jgi:hypothetical protein
MASTQPDDDELEMDRLWNDSEVSECSQRILCQPKETKRQKNYEAHKTEATESPYGIFTEFLLEQRDKRRLGIDDVEFAKQEQELDSTCNVYSEETETLPDTAVLPQQPQQPQQPQLQQGKVWFDEASHSYALVDEKGSYPNLLLSGSKVRLYLPYLLKSCMNPATQLDVAMNGLKEDTKDGLPLHASALQETLKEFQTVLVKYFHYICERLEDAKSEGTEFVLPLSYQERHRTFRKWTKKELVYFISSRTYRRLEDALATGKQEVFDLTDSDDYLVVQELQALLDPFYTNLPGIVQALFPRRVADYPLGASYIKEKYGLPSKYGTQFHAYLEHRYKGLDKEECLAKYKPEELEDIEQSEAFIQKYPVGYFSAMELRVGSFLYKICGSIDAIRVITLPTGEKVEVIVDWKRSASIFEDAQGKMVLKDIYAPGLWGNERGAARKRHASVKLCQITVDNDVCFPDEPSLYEPLYPNIAYSDAVFDYMYQQATYRKLRLLSGVKVYSKAYLPVFHPSLPGYRIVRLDLFAKCGKYDIVMAKFVQWIFNKHREHVQAFLSRIKKVE